MGVFLALTASAMCSKYNVPEWNFVKLCANFAVWTPSNNPQFHTIQPRNLHCSIVYKPAIYTTPFLHCTLLSLHHILPLAGVPQVCQGTKQSGVPPIYLGLHHPVRDTTSLSGAPLVCKKRHHRPSGHHKPMRGRAYQGLSGTSVFLNLVRLFAWADSRDQSLH